MRAMGLLLGCWIGATSFAPIARAQETVGWDAPPECPGLDELTARIEELASSPITGSMGATVSREADAFVAQIHGASAGDEARELRASSCDTLTSAVALVMATAMTEVPPGPAARAPDPADVPSESQVDESAPTSPSPDDPLRLVVSATSGAVIGLFGGAEALVGVALGVRADGFEVAVGWSRAFRIDEPDTDTERATLRLGWVMRWAPLEVAFRVLGDVYTSFRGLGNDRSGGLWGMVGAGVELRLWIDDAAAVTLSFDGTIPVARRPVQLEGARPLDELPTLAGVMTGGIFFPIP